MKNILITLIFIFSLNINALAIDSYTGLIDKSPQKIVIKFKNFDGYLVSVMKNNDGIMKGKLQVRNNKFLLEMGINKDGSISPEITEFGGAKIELKLGNKLSVIKAEMKEGKYGKWKDIRNTKIAGVNLTKILTSSFDRYYGRAYYLDKPFNISLVELLALLGISQKDLPDELNRDLTYIFRGTTCYKNRESFLIEVLFDNKYAGYELYDSMTGTRFGGRWEFSVLGEKVFENHDQSYFVGVEDNCNISSVNTSLDGGIQQ